MTTGPTRDAFESLADKLGLELPAIRMARAESDRVMRALRNLATTGGNAGQVGSSVIPPDGAIVVLGSLARREWTRGSDVDWTLLLDGQADPSHRTLAHEFADRLAQDGYTKPGPTGVFGSLSFSHELIHRIGGDHDTNANLTQRLLLILESASLTEVDAHSRVVRGILKRYIESERSFLAESGRLYKVPRFLLNDMVRYWRTVAVDYVNKRWERGELGSALRNLKLRFSRKLMFVSGLLTCFSCYLDSPDAAHRSGLKNEAEASRAVQMQIAERIGIPPLDILCSHLAARALPETARILLTAYNHFLARIDDHRLRGRMGELALKDAYDDGDFNELRKHSHDFQDGLNQMFYHDDPDTRALMLKYGVF